MKKFLLLLFLLPVVGITFAQTSKGSFVVGLHNYSPGQIASFGSVVNLFPQTNGLGISFGSSKTKVDGELLEGKENSTLIGLSLNTLYFVENQFAIGLVGSFSSASTVYKEDGEEDDKSSLTLFLVGPEARYYFDTGAKAKVYLKGGAAIGSVSSKYNGEGGDPSNLTQYGGGGGISLFPVPTVSVDFGLGYNVLNIIDNSEFGDYKSIYGSLTFDIGFGCYF